MSRSRLPSTLRVFALAAAVLLVVAMGCEREALEKFSRQTSATGPATIDDFVALSGDDVQEISEALDRIEADWPEGSVTMLVDSLRYLKENKAKFGVAALLNKKANLRDLRKPEDVLKGIWHSKYKPHPHFAEFKAKLYARLDPQFAEYFDDSYPATIRLDEIRWGGVKRDGIPPLKDPEVVKATDASFMQDSNVVFGVFVNGEARCYPKKILGYHEMVKDHLGGVSINGVYCTLCGSMIIYYTELDGKHYELGTSGFLYRSNKLMYDHETKSLWSTIEGKPVVGPLVGKGIQLKRHHVVTTTWGQWTKDHPDTTVITINTGYVRDYSEGNAYRDYFSNDELMINVPQDDFRVRNKAEVVALVFENAPEKSLAISADFLMENRIYHDSLADQDFVVLTDESGANRVYETGGHKFVSWKNESAVVDEAGTEWKVSELKLDAPEGRSLQRLPAHRAFWFGWHAAHPDTRLVR